MAHNYTIAHEQFDFYSVCNGKKHLSCAFPEDSSITLYFKISRKKGAFNVSGHIYDDNSCSDIPLNIEWTGLENGFDVYCASLPVKKKGIFFLRCYFKTTQGNENFLFPDGNDVMNVTLYSKEYTTPNWIKGGIIYQIFVDRFAKSSHHRIKKKQNVTVKKNWDKDIPDFPDKPGDPFANNCFFGGSLYGVAEKLDYLKSLGVNTLYLNPIFDAASNHKYDTADYMKIDEMFGGEKAFDHLIKEIKKRDMHLVLDGVFNHTGSDSIYFNKDGNYDSLGAYQSKDSPYYDWYTFKNYPDKYECWWGVTILPCIKKNCDTFREYICGENGVAAHYMKKGVDGFRLDVADELSDRFLEQLKTTIRGIDPQALLYGEVWEDASEKIAYGNRRKYFFGSQLDGVMNYPLRTAIINYVQTASSQDLAATVTSLYMHYPKFVSDAQMNLLGTHDTERILNVLSGENTDSMTNLQLSSYKLPEQSRKNALELLRLAVFLNYTLPGVPCIYYGDEAGMEGGRDPFNRMPYPYGKEDTELIDFYRTLGKIRTKHSEFKSGSFDIVCAHDGYFAFKRDSLLCVCNMGKSRVITLEKPFKDIISGKASVMSDRGYHTFTLENRLFAILK